MGELSRVEVAALRVSIKLADEVECVMRLSDMCVGCWIGGSEQTWYDGPNIIIYYFDHTTFLHLQGISSVGREAKAQHSGCVID